MRPRHEESATVTLRGRACRQLTVSAILQRDPQYLKSNRILILGSEDVMTQAMSLQGDAAIEWEIHSNSNWPGRTDIEHTRTGTGFMRTVGMAQGVSIAEDSIQAVAEIAIYESVDHFRGVSATKQSAEYWFLQRSRHWPVIPNPFRRFELRRVAEQWMRISSANLRFRLISTTHLRDDERVSREVEQLIIPGVEIEPIDKKNDCQFRTKAQTLWFSVRVLLTFGLRQYIYPLMESVAGEDARTTTWHTVEVKARQSTSTATDTTDYPHLLRVLPKAAARLFQMPEQHGLMHGAAYGYASSFSAGTIESGLTSSVQAIERLVSAFEAVRGFEADLVDRKAWKQIAKCLKRQVGNLNLESVLETRMKRALSVPMRFSLQERIERMSRFYQQHWNSSTEAIFSGTDKMIKARNDIVHGRLVADANLMHTERLRARAIFETLFLWFLGSANASTASRARLQLQHLERRS